LNDEEYRQGWKRKLAWYRSQNILPIEEGGGPEGTLITTEDGADGGIDALKIKTLINSVFNK
jgi:hypothetical protein